MEVIYEDNHIIAVNKTCREIVQGDKTGDTPLSDMLKAWLKEKYCKPGNVFVGVTHRLDRPVSGVVLFAKTSKALARLNEMFRVGEVKKTYWAIVKNCPPAEEGELVNWLVRNEKQNKSYAYDTERTNAKKAVLHYKVIVSLGQLLSVGYRPEDRPSSPNPLPACQMGCPIKGDLKYGFPRSNPDGGICLHSRSAEFIHPVSKQPVSLSLLCLLILFGKRWSR